MDALCFDPYHGASGDMVVGALLDLGVPLAAIAAPLESMIPGEFRVETERVTRGGLAGVKFHVRTAQESDPKHEHGEVGHHHHGHRHEYDHGHDHGHPHHPDHPHRNLHDILAILDGADLPDWVAHKAAECFTRLAEAEASVHGTTIDEIHFHEVGAVDSIVDTVGALLAVQELGADRIYSTPMAVGFGTIRCAHGTLPLPAPATAALLRGFPTRPGAAAVENAELCTPTGAALIVMLAEPIESLPPMRIDRIGCGAGSRDDPGAPNLLRAVCGELTGPPHEGSAGELMQVECVLDDMSPELLGYLFERLHTAGAVEVTTQAVGLKKSRPGVLLTVLAPTQFLEPVRNTVFAETTTFGMRYFPVRRFTLERRHVEVETPWGTVRVKVGEHAGEPVTASPEYEDCRRAAEQHDVPLRRVYEAALHAFRSRP